MFVGHYSAAFAVKAVQLKTPLWSLFLAVQFVDILWALFVFMGIERGHLDTVLPSNPLVLEFMPYTHSLLGSAGWAALAFIAARKAWGNAAGFGIALAVLSHFFIDLIVHRPDLTLAGEDAAFGFGLWNHPLIALLLEIGMLAAGIAWCLAANHAASTTRRAWWLVWVAFVLIQLGMNYGPLPPTIEGVAAAALFSYLLFAWVVARLERRYPFSSLPES